MSPRWPHHCAKYVAHLPSSASPYSGTIGFFGLSGTADLNVRALQAGASGFLLKDTPPQQLIHAVRVVGGGESMLSPTVTTRLITHFAADPRTDRRRAALDLVARLSPREVEVLVEVGRGLANAEIGRALHMSEATVKGHVSRLLVKLDSTNRVQVAILAHHAGLCD